MDDNQINEMVSWPVEKKLEYLTNQLKDKVSYWKDWTYGYCYSDEETAEATGKERAYSDAADDIEWMLRSLGLL